MNPKLIAWLAAVSGDPLAFVRGAFPWGEPGTRLEKFGGPEPWQVAILQAIRDGLPISQAIQLATASGHGVGKSALVSWITIWALATMPDTRGVITANTETQLKTKTWAELGKWFNIFIGREHFYLSATAIFSADPTHERTWRIDQVPWSERNTEAFAGLHNQGRRILVIFDEASAIPDIIWETAEGALTDKDTEIIWCVFGNPTRSSGRFRECFPGGRDSRSWQSHQVDSRQISFTNKTFIQQMIDREGEDSDYVRIRIRGVFPRHGEQEFISNAVVEDAMRREAASYLHEPLVLGVDVARYGDNETVLYLRRGRDAQTIPPIRLRGVSVPGVAARVAALAQEHRIDAIFVDGGGVGGGVVDCLRQLNVACFDIQFGARPDEIGWSQGPGGSKYANKRAEIWGALRDWLAGAALPDDRDLKAQLIAPTYTLNLQGRILLESKEDMRRRGAESPDIADALALTFALPVAMSDPALDGNATVESEYNPYSDERMVA